ncbi:MAG: hypothetical protein WC441_01715 [Patescibacteria group bacterium]
MLNKLFGSELRARVLEKILAAPEKKYYLRALSRELKVTPAALQKELDNLEKLGLVASGLDTEISDPKNKEKKFFILKRNFLLFDELQALFAKAQLFFVQEFLGRLEKLTNLKYFVLTGRFSGNPLSKTDLLIVSRIKHDKFLPILNDLEKKIGQEVNFTLMDETEFYYRRDIMDIFLYSILNNRKIVMVDNLEPRKGIIKG